MADYSLNSEVTAFLDEQEHPLRAEIEQLRRVILSTVPDLKESIKWNGPNYSINQVDCLTMRIHPPKQIQLVFHRGAKVKELPAEKLISGNDAILKWKENDRAVASFKHPEDITTNDKALKEIIEQWVQAVK